MRPELSRERFRPAMDRQLDALDAARRAIVSVRPALEIVDYALPTRGLADLIALDVPSRRRAGCSLRVRGARAQQARLGRAHDRGTHLGSRGGSERLVTAVGAARPCAARVAHARDRGAALRHRGAPRGFLGREAVQRHVGGVRIAHRELQLERVAGGCSPEPGSSRSGPRAGSAGARRSPWLPIPCSGRRRRAGSPPLR
jgi:hypothetical protein